MPYIYVLQLLIPIGTNVVSRPQVSRSGHFLRFYDFIGFISWFLKKWRPVHENWSQGSGLTTGYVAQNYFLGPRPQGQVIFWDFMILLDFSHDSWKNEVLFVKIGVRIPDLCWIHLLGPSGPNLVSRPQDPRARHFLRFNILLDSSHDSWENEVLLVKIGDRVLDLRLDMSSGPSSPNLVSRSQAPRSRHFLRFYDFTGFIPWFLGKWGPVCEKWS